MARILVSGLTNLETTLRVEHFPLDYFPVCYPFHGISSTISGVGVNLTRALTGLGEQVYFLSLVGKDGAGRLALAELARAGVPVAHVLPALEQTAQSVILYDDTGRRQIHVDLKDIQEQDYPAPLAAGLLSGCDLAVLCNINFSRPLLGLARQAGLRIATDVHAIGDLEDPYNRDFMASADILFMSHEHLPAPPEEWARRVMDRYPAELVGIGLGADGALLAVRSSGALIHQPAVRMRPVVSTVGAGDALFACFLRELLRTNDPAFAIRRAVLFAGYKIGSTGAAEGLLDAAGLDRLSKEQGSALAER